MLDDPGFNRQIRTCQRRDHDPALDDQRQRDGVLLAAEKPLRAVDRIERPEAVAVIAAASVVDPAADLAVNAVAGSHGCFRSDGADVPEHLFEDESVLGAFQLEQRLPRR